MDHKVTPWCFYKHKSMFVDEAKILVKAGNGGKGCESYLRGRHLRYPRANGGDGGKGGNIIFETSFSVQNLLIYRYKKHHQAEDGGHGSSKDKKGKDGADCVLKVPVGTIVKDEQSGLIIRDLLSIKERVMVAKGGQGGIGNARKRVPTPPKLGEERVLNLELKIMADVGLIGFPNAGKSSLISALTNVQSKAACYPFTTKQPILGIMEEKDFKCVLADLPGIIEGAHEGKGLGTRFLRHAERTKMLVHVLDMAGSEERNPLKDYEKLINELKFYNDQFLLKPRIVVANKMDLPASEGHLKKFKKKYRNNDIIPVSALQKIGLQELIGKIKEILCQDSSNPSNDSSSK